MLRDVLHDGFMQVVQIMRCLFTLHFFLLGSTIKVGENDCFFQLVALTPRVHEKIQGIL